MNYNRIKSSIIIVFSAVLFACTITTANKNPLDKPEGYLNSKDGTAIYYTKAGDQEDDTLVFIHCWGCNGTYWEAQIKYFAKNYQVISLDLAGHGLSGANRDNFTIDKFADDIVTVVKSLGLNDVVLVGHSLGAAAAIEASAKRPREIKGIIAVDTFETGYQWPTASEIAQEMIPYQKNFYKTTYPKIKNKFTPQTDKSLVYRIAKDIALAPPDIGTNSLENLYHWLANDYQNSRNKLTVPLVLINSRQNNVPVNSAEKTFYVPFVGHYIPQEAPKKFNSVLEQAIEQLANGK